MRKLVLLALLLSTPAYAEMDGDAQKFATYGQCILKYDRPCPPKTAPTVGFPIPLPPPQYAKPYTGLL